VAKANKKPTRKVSDILHNIMRTSTNSAADIPKTEQCPQCGLHGNFTPPSIRKGKKLIVTFTCPDGHVFSKQLALK